MSITYAQKQVPAQKKEAPGAVSIHDSSLQGEALQRKADLVSGIVQRIETPHPNNTGMPDNLKSGIESLSGYSMDNVRVHYNSSKPATVQALAYTQGTDIHVAPGQEKHLPHEAWHVAQQMAGRVAPTTNINGMPVNDNAALEHEADVMGEKAVTQRKEASGLNEASIGEGVCQRTEIHYQPMTIKYEYETYDTTALKKFQASRTQSSTNKGAGKRSKKRTETRPNSRRIGKKDIIEQLRQNARKLRKINVFKTEVGSVDVGHLTSARLTPNQPVNGTEPGYDHQLLMDAIKPDNYETNPFIKGHLLNHHLGGLGIKDNMIPITKNANGLHEMFVEQGVKNLVYAQKIKNDHNTTTDKEAIKQLRAIIIEKIAIKNALETAINKQYVKSLLEECEAREIRARETASAALISAPITSDKPIDYIIQADLLNDKQPVSKENPPEVLLSCSVQYDTNLWNASIHSGPGPEQASVNGDITSSINEFLKPPSSPSNLGLNFLHISASELRNVGWGGALTTSGGDATGGAPDRVNNTFTYPATDSTVLGPSINVELFKAMKAMDALKEGIKEKIASAPNQIATCQIVANNVNALQDKIINSLIDSTVMQDGKKP